MKVDLHGVEGPLLAPLWGWAKLSRAYPSVFNDAKAIELVEQIDVFCLPVFPFNCFPQELIAAERRLETLKGNSVPVTT